MQRQDELVALADRGVDEQAEAFGRGRAVAFGGLALASTCSKETVGQVAEQVLAGREVTVERADADTGVGRDRGHGHVRALSVHRRGRGPDAVPGGCGPRRCAARADRVRSSRGPCAH